MHRLKNIVLYIFAKLFYLFQLKKYIIFESNSDFCDNSKALYDYIVENNLAKDYKIYWAVIDPKKYKKNDNYSMILKRFDFKKPFQSIKHLYVSTRAEYTFYTHMLVGNKYVKKQTRCFLMHGTSLKNLKNVYGNYFNDSTHAIVTSEFTKKIHNETKNGIGKISHILGYPRNDKLFVDEAEKESIKEKLGIKDINKVITWMPTFKQHKDTDRNDFGNEQNGFEIISGDNFNELNNKLKKNNTCLIIKLHPAQDLKYIDMKESTNIVWLTNEDLYKKEIDTYSVMSISDALITDFSSVYTDYLLLDKPIGFELSNIETYKKGLGFSVDNPLDYMPGAIIQNTQNLKDFIDDVLSNKDDYKKERKKIKDLYHKYDDNNSSKRIVEFFDIGKEK